MADNAVVANPGVGGATFASDQIGGIEFPRAKIVWGVDGTATDTSAAAPLPVVQTGTPALPTGAATAAKQPALGTAGAASADVITVQGVASMTALKVDPSGVTSPVSAASLPLPALASTSTKQSDGSQKTQIVDGSGNVIGATSNALDVNIKSGGGSGGTSSTIGAAVPATATEAGFSDGTNMQAARVFDMDSGAGTQYGLGVNLRQIANGGSVEAGIAANPLRTDPTGTTTQPVSGTVTITPSGTQTVAGAKTNNNAAPGATNIGALPAVANAAAPTQTEGNLVALRATLSGDLAVTLDSEAVVLGAGAAVIGALTANQSVNAAQVGGTAIDTNSGNKSAGTQRMVLATDQPNLTTPLNVALAANQSVNAAQINGVTPLMGNGVSGTGALRVSIASDSTGQVALAAGANTIGALTANQSVNVAQINGVAATMGNGVSGTGVQRVTLASDSTGQVAAIGPAAHGASISGAPVREGSRALTADYTAVTTGQVADAIATVLGKRIVLPYCLPGQAWKYVGAAGGLVNTTAITIAAAAGAGIKNYITSITLVNAHQTIGTEVVINDGAAGTAIFRTWCQFAGGGCSIKLDPPLASSANTLLEIKEITATATAGVVAQILGYTAAE